MVTHDQAEALSISDRVVVMHEGRIQQVDAPHRLYEQPASRFVGSFVGKTNWLQGVARGGAVELAGGLRLPLADAGTGTPDGTTVALVLRPEKLRLLPPGQGRLPARVAERFFLGSQWLYRVDSALGELEVACANDGRAPWPEQGEVALDWADDVARRLPAGGDT
jgi:putative spermidine/putrescine transport system ATP-binding protein